MLLENDTQYVTIEFIDVGLNDVTVGTNNVIANMNGDDKALDSRTNDVVAR